MEVIKAIKHKFPYKWNLSDGYPAKEIEPNGLNVFGTFICGGGSTMGYKLAGFNHLGGVEIDPKVAAVYKANHNPKHLYVEDIREFVNRDDLPLELYNLDLLDGSPPCSSFSMAGNREKDWGKEKVFREGQALQTLDDLFFDYIALAKKLQPKVVIAENVKGLIQGNAKSYVRKIKAGFEDAGYKVQLFLLNAASMGVPQKRERVFFICQRNDLKLPKLELSFNEVPITYGEFALRNGKKITDYILEAWNAKEPHHRNIAQCKEAAGMKISDMNCQLQKDDEVPNTLTSKGNHSFILYSHPKYFSNEELLLASSFPIDYKKQSVTIGFVTGMSVPPVMTAQIAHQIYLQWFGNCDKTVKHGN